MSICKEILKAIDFRTLNEKIVIPCRMAERSFQINNDHINSMKEFQSECSRYWEHLYRTYNNQVPQDFADPNHCLSQANMLINQAMGNRGGVRLAYEKSKSEGFSYAISEMTNVFIQMQKNNAIDMILSTYIDPYDYDQKRQLIIEYQEIINKPLTDEGEIADKINHYKKVFQSHAANEEQLFYGQFS